MSDVAEALAAVDAWIRPWGLPEQRPTDEQLRQAAWDAMPVIRAALEPPDAELVEWAKAHLNVHKMSRHNWCCAVCDAARYILRAAGRG